MQNKASKELSVIVPFYNEEEMLPLTVEAVRKELGALNIKYEVIFINDGSTDGSLKVLESVQWEEMRVISLVSNSGQTSAVDAGYRESVGEYVITMDADLQHPPEIIPDLLHKIKNERLDVLYCIRPDRSEEKFLKRVTALLYYRAIRFLSGINIETSASEYRIVSKQVVNVIETLPPGNRMLRLLIPSFGFPSGVFYYSAKERKLGETKYTFRKMLSLALNSILGFSTKPLKLAIYVGLFAAGLSTIGFFQAIYAYFQTDSVPGWTSMISSMFFMFSLLFVILGIMGAYIGKIVEQLSGKPEYIVKKDKI